MNRWSVHNTAATAPICLFVNKTPSYLNFSTWGRNLSLIGHSTFSSWRPQSWRCWLSFLLLYTRLWTAPVWGGGCHQMKPEMSVWDHLSESLLPIGYDKNYEEIGDKRQPWRSPTPIRNELLPCGLSSCKGCMRIVWPVATGQTPQLLWQDTQRDTVECLVQVSPNIDWYM